MIIGQLSETIVKNEQNKEFKSVFLIFDKGNSPVTTMEEYRTEKGGVCCALPAW